MEADKIIQKAKIRLIVGQPFFASLALGMNYIPDGSIKTACTNGKDIKYNPAWVEAAPFDEVVTLIAHEVMHPASLHHTRLGNKDLKLWNSACDYAINPLLVEAGFVLPAGSLNDSQYHNISAEEIYRKLQEKQDDKDGKGNGQGKGSGNQQPQPDNGSDPADFGQVEAPKDMTEAEIEEEEATQKQKLVQAMNAAKQAGKSGGGLERMVNDLIQPKVDWKEVLMRFVAEIARNDYTWSKPSPRYLPMGLYLPKLENTEIGKIVFAIDTSGSVNKKLLAEFTGELKEAMQMFSFPVTAIHCDNKIREVEEIDEDSVILPKGGGGTDFRPPFVYTDENLPDTKAMVYFTDGHCDDFPGEPDYPVLWVVYGRPLFNPPFGETIHIKK